ncbi:hypothetical protein FOL47_010361 [Perkinsus chesapeaki]|uniref:Peptidase A1 domain-containing protein n=1 Tax=Perkinsus chesapeaki TaxID=330153 RepID=A0A7J6N1H9_PERCH|nr:hypothetical protein FOL47_010361 [Perkinsus chesapeaki]
MILSKTILPIILPSIAGLSITLPFIDGAVTFVIDGNQRTSFRIDTGSARFFAFYGPEYEKQKGAGSCAKIKACYFCTVANPCDDIFQREQWHVAFGDFTAYTYVRHTVSATVGGILIPDIEMGLAISASHGFDNDPFSAGLLGLLKGRTGIPETFLDQLLSRNLISSHSYWVHTTGNIQSFAGSITLGGIPKAEMKASRVVHMSRDLVYFSRTISIPLWPVRLISQKGHLLTRQWMTLTGRQQDGPLPAILDTGCKGIFMSDPDFNEFFRVAKKHLFDIPGSSDYYIKEGDLHNLPTLVYQIGESPNQMDIRIKPKHYVRYCGKDGYCLLLVTSTNKTDQYDLGEPLFYAYDVGFQFSGKHPAVYFRRNDAEYATLGEFDST